MATGSIHKEYNPDWTNLVNDLTTANTAYDKTHTVSFPPGTKEICFTLQRASNGRTFATSVMPYLQFNGGAVYAIGYWGVSANFQPISCVCIHTDSTHLEIAVPTLSEAVRVRVWVR